MCGTGQLVFNQGHEVQNKSPGNLAKYASIEQFARKYGIDFYPTRRGISHQILVEEGYAFSYTPRPATATAACTVRLTMLGPGLYERTQRCFERQDKRGGRFFRWLKLNPEGK